MKRCCLFMSLVMLANAAFAQIENSVMADEFKEVSKFGSRQSGFEGIQTYSSGIVNGNQFFSSSWCEGTVSTNFNETFGKNYSFLFDKVRQELFMKWKDTAVILLADKKQISSFTLNTDRVHYFMAGSKFDPALTEIFFEVLVGNEKKYTLLKQVKTKFVKADNRDMEKIKLGENYDSFVDEVTYYLFCNHFLQQVSLKAKSIKKISSVDQNKINTYFFNHPDNKVDENFIMKLVQFLNESV